MVHNLPGDDAKAAFNPSIAIGLLVLRKLSVKEWFIGVAIQISGAFIGGGLALLLENTNLQTKFGSGAYAAMFGIGSDVSFANVLFIILDELFFIGI